MLSEYSEVGKIEKYQPQISGTRRYRYDLNYYLIALPFVLVLIMFSYTTYVAVTEGIFLGVLSSAFYLLFTLLLFMGFATSVLCNEEGITVKYIFLFSRSPE